MYSYECYGLGIRSEFPLPELAGVDAASEDLVLRRGQVERGRWDLILGQVRIQLGSAHTIFEYAGVGAFAVCSGREIVVDPEPGVDDATVRAYVVGPMLAFALHQRGLLVLHASSVLIGGAVVGFMGGAGWGKSTMAGILQEHGFPVVADDVTPVQLTDDGPMVYPGPAQLKLWPEAIRVLGDSPEALPRVHHDVDKRWRSVTGAPRERALPLQRLYVLGEGPQPSIEALSPMLAVPELVRHSYAVELLGPTNTANLHLRQCAALAEQVPIARLVRPRDLPLLPQLAHLVQRDAVPVR